ncbi:serine hydrolase [Mycolicibacterium sp. CBMA 226]|uniref:serine hydrolase n=1 Tax=Mycolicibacterium sp. CBMA 226 TaxID=2606611 RepID=UPI0012DE3DB8|nr:serine hydrolase [Mycolicibacterium sp. CBMA 226]MUL75327.1 serine hydrolase [Mycolicibacterium sp. CBMA 226]
MRPQQLKLLTITAAAAAVMLTAGCEAKVYGAPPPNRIALTVVPVVTALEMPEAPAAEPAAALAGLDARERSATNDAAAAGASISAAVLDRNTGQLIITGDRSPMPIASVAKLFIADDLLLQEAKGQIELTAADRQALDTMLRSSDDSAAEAFWNRSGGNDVIARVAARYGLTGTSVPYDGKWWNTMSTTTDLVHYYDQLLNGSGGLPPERASIILTNLAASTPAGADGYPQRFGIPDGLYGEPVAVKQGWMPEWNGNNWMHMSTGVVGADRRYVMAIGSLQPTDDATARTTITNAVKTMFPGGRIS